MGETSRQSDRCSDNETSSVFNSSPVEYAGPLGRPVLDRSGVGQLSSLSNRTKWQRLPTGDTLHSVSPVGNRSRYTPNVITCNISCGSITAKNYHSINCRNLQNFTQTLLVSSCHVQQFKYLQAFVTVLWTWVCKFVGLLSRRSDPRSRTSNTADCVISSKIFWSRKRS